MAALVLKVQSKLGKQVLRDLNQLHTILDLKRELSSLCSINESALQILSGFPPKPLNLENGTKTLEAAGINSGDTLIVEEKSGRVPQATPGPGPTPALVEFQNQMTARGVLLRKVVPADNSCLFTSVGYVLSGK